MAAPGARDRVSPQFGRLFDYIDFNYDMCSVQGTAITNVNNKSETKYMDNSNNKYAPRK